MFHYSWSPPSLTVTVLLTSKHESLKTATYKLSITSVNICNRHLFNKVDAERPNKETLSIMTGINNTAVIEKKIHLLAGDDKSLSDYESVINIVMPNDKHVC